MCHLLLLTPIFGLALFLIFPWPMALPAYSLVLIASVLLFYKAIKAMRMPIYVGQEALLGQEVEVMAPIHGPSMAQYLVRQGGEIWSASCGQQLCCGDKAVITGFEGSRPRIQPLGDASPTAVTAKTECSCH